MGFRALLTALVLAIPAIADEPPAQKPQPKFTVGRSTTFVDGPLTADGYVDFQTALNDRLRGKTEPRNNIVVGLLEVLGPKPESAELPEVFFQTLGIPKPPAEGDYFIPGSRFFAEELTKGRGKDLDAEWLRSMSQPWKAADAPKRSQWLEKNGKALDAVAAVVRRPDYFHPLISSSANDGRRQTLIAAQLNAVQQCRDLGSALVQRAMLRCGDGKFEAAWSDILACHRLGRALARGGTAIEMLVGIAVASQAHRAVPAFLAAARPDAAAALRYQADLLALPPWPRYADKLNLGERLTALDALQGIRRGDPDNDRGDEPKPDAQRIEADMAGLDWDAMFRMVNTWYDRMVAAAAKPTRADRVAALKAIDTELEKLVNDPARVKEILPKGRPDAKDDQLRRSVSEQVAATLLGLTTPAVLRLLDAGDRADQSDHLSALICALAAYQADHGEFPEKLTDLVPKYQKRIPEDIFSGQALRYSRNRDGCRVYSVGPNGKDDEGRGQDSQPPGDDITVRLSGPGQR